MFIWLMVLEDGIRNVVFVSGWLCHDMSEVALDGATGLAKVSFCFTNVVVSTSPSRPHNPNHLLKIPPPNIPTCESGDQIPALKLWGSH